MPVLLDTLETVLAYAADRLMESLAAGGVYNPDNIWKKPIEQLFDDLMNSDIIDIAVNGLDTAFDSLLAGAVGSFGESHTTTSCWCSCARAISSLYCSRSYRPWR